MSMIEIQTTRNQNAKSGQAQARYKEDLEKTGLEAKSSTPVYAGMMLLALGLYLKSSLVGKSHAGILPNDSKLPEDEGGVAGTSLTETRLERFERGQQDFAQSGEENLQQAAEVGAPNVPFSPLIPVEPLQYNLRNFQAGAETNFKQPNFVWPQFPALPVNDNQSGFSGGSGEGGNSGNSGGTAGGGDEVSEDGDGDGNSIPLNRRPQVISPVVLHDQFVCIMLMFALSDLLRGATDPEGDRLSVKNVRASSGDLEFKDGSYHFHGEDVGPVTLTYEITDGKLSTVQTASFNLLVKPPISGTDGDDILAGSACDDDLIGKAGNDQVDGRGGDDNIEGGDGNDHIVGGAGNDVVWGGLGDDVIFGNAGNDTLSGGAGNDRVFGGDGNDTIDAGDGNDIVYADAGNDVVDGGKGDDEIHDGAGQDRADGGAGNDRIAASIDGAADTFTGGEGFDTLDYSATQNDLTVDLGVSNVSSEETGVDHFASIESILSGSGDDHFKASLGEVIVALEDSTEVVEDSHVVKDSHNESGAVSDTSMVLDGGGGSDTLEFSARSDGLVLDIVEGIARGEHGPNIHFSNFEVFVGGEGDDLFIVGDEIVSLDGRGGDDIFRFLETTSENEHAHQIRNFEVGDRINVSSYDIFDTEEDQHTFESVFSTENSGTNETLDHTVAIRIRNQDSESDSYKTFVDVDFDGDANIDMSIEIEGHHHLIINTHSLIV